MNKIAILAIITLVGLSTIAISHFNKDANLRANLLTAATDFCPQPQYRSDAWMNTFTTALKAINTDEQLMAFLDAQIPTDSHIFSTPQILSIIKFINFDSSRLQAIKIMNPYILTLTAQNIVDILSTFSFSDNKFQALSAIANTLSDVSDANKKAIVDTFSFSSDKQKAQSILDTIAARNCIYGTITEKVAAFIIDISGSMDQTFKANGETVSRLQYVKAQLTKTLAEQLKPYQKFNVIIFGNSASQWKPDCVDATPENINAAITYINGLRTNGATNISGGLDLAFATKQALNGIYLLSDGVPNYGIQTVDGIKKYLADKNASRTEKVHVNTVSFIMGGTESQSERQLSFQFLNAISDITNGSFKGISA